MALAFVARRSAGSWARVWRRTSDSSGGYFDAHPGRALTNNVEVGGIANAKREMHHRPIIHLQFKMFHKADVVVVKFKAEEVHLLLRKAHRGAAVGMIERGKLQIEQVDLESLGPLEIVNVDDVMLQFGGAQQV